MIRPLRIRHRRMAGVLAVVGPVVFLLGLWARTPPPVVDAFPRGVHEGRVTGRPDTVRLGETWVAVTLGTNSATGRPGVALAPVLDSLSAAPGVTAIGGPDVLLYWSHQPPGDALPVSAILLGTIRGERPTTFDLPSEIRPGPSHLVAYSLPYQRVLGVLPVTIPAERD